MIRISANDSRMILVGDSRFVGLKSVVGDQATVIAKGAQGYKWFVNTAIDEVNRVAKPGDTIVVGLGVNDLPNVDKYIQKMNELTSGIWNKYTVKYLSVNPVDDDVCRQIGYLVTNAEIVKFNEKAKKNLKNIAWIDTYDKVMAMMPTGTFDGVHYTNQVNHLLWNILKGEGVETVTDENGCIIEEEERSAGNAGSVPGFDPHIWREINPYAQAGLMGQCTWFAWSRFYEIYGYSPGFLGDGAICAQQLLQNHPDKFKRGEVGSIPKAGAVFSTSGKGTNKNHVGIVIAVDGQTVTIQDCNYDGVSNPWEVAIKDWRTRQLTVSQMEKEFGAYYANPIESVSIR